MPFEQKNRVTLKERLADRVSAWTAAGLGRNPFTIDEPGHAPVVEISGRKFINFSSNDSLGQSVSEEWRAEVGECFSRFPPSGTASRLAGGHWRMVAEAEDAFARYFGYDECVFFPSGYQANLACVTGLLHPGQEVFADRRIHASMARALPLSNANVHTYAHVDCERLERRMLAAASAPRTAPANPDTANPEAANPAAPSAREAQAVVLSESLFSMEGSRLDVRAMAALKERHGFFLIADEAHAMGALGSGGRGVCSEIPGLADVAVGTFGKALGFFGAFLLLPQGFTVVLEHLASALMHSTALPPAHAACVLRLVRRLPGLESQRAALRDISDYFRQELHARGIPTSGEAHIIAVPVGNEAKTAQCGRILRENGVLALAARHPTVPHGKGLLRFNLTALHTREHADHAVRALCACGLAEK